MDTTVFEEDLLNVDEIAQDELTWV